MDGCGCGCYAQSAGEESMPIVASARTKHLAAMLLIGAVALISASMALAQHSGGGSSSFGGGSAAGGHTGRGSSSSGSHSSPHSTVSSSTHRATAVSQGRTTTSSPKTKKRWLFFRRSHVMHTDCLSQPESTTRVHNDAGCDPRQLQKP